MDTIIDKIMEKPKETGTEIAHKNLEPISFFEKDAGFVFVYKKTEKLASAIYIITNLFSENEPMKWTLRKKVGDLLSFNLGYKDISGISQLDFTHNVKSKVLEIVSLLEVSFRAGLISNMNFSILKQEFSSLIEVLSSASAVSKESLYSPIPKAFFESQNDGLNTSKNYYTEPLNSQSRVSPNEAKDRNTSVNTTNLKRSNRQNIIIALLKKKKDLTIKDISDVIKDCSEKTIQRELNSFIVEGVVKRTGERRWSKYSLN